MIFYIKNILSFLFNLITKGKEGPGITYDIYEVKDLSLDVISADYIFPGCNHTKVYLEHLPILKKMAGVGIMLPSHSESDGKDKKSCSNLACEKINPIS